ncbi:MAG: hypothetical protein LBR16_09850 [Treponema sp.]|jgi:hypothetical protein|nr:hypothetical protein [Treponema sp.]
MPSTSGRTRFRSQADHVAKTWLLSEEDSGDIVAYMSLVADGVRLSVAEKELQHLDYPFKTLPAMKVAKLAVSEAARQKHRGIGTYMLYQAGRIARACNAAYFASRFLTVDADYAARATARAINHSYRKTAQRDVCRARRWRAGVLREKRLCAQCRIDQQKAQNHQHEA